MARRSDKFGQYAADEPVTTPGDFSYRNPVHPYTHPPRRGAAFSLGGGTGGSGGGGGGGAPQQQQEKPGDVFERRWRQSEGRAERIRDSLSGRPWGHPQDYEDVLGPNRSGGLEKVTTGPRQTGLRKDEGYGPSPVPAKPKPGNGNGGGLSGGAAQKVPTGVGSPYL